MRLCVGARMSYVGAPLSSDRQDWATPQAFLDWLEEEHGWTPDLDAAAADETAKAPRWFTEEDNGLLQPWAGDVWLNPPFGNALPNWLDKCANEIERDEVNSIFCLIPARTDTKWFHEKVMPHAYIVYLIKGRFTFGHESSVKGANAPFPNMLVLYRKVTRIQGYMQAGITTLEVPKGARGFQQ